MTDHFVHLGCGLAGMAAMEARSADHAILDPPYSERVHAGKGTERRNDGAGAEALDFAHLAHRQRVRVAAELCRVTKRWIVAFCDVESVLLWKVALERAGAVWCCAGTWVKVAPMPRMDGTRPAYGTEAICIAHAPRAKGKTRWNGGGRTAIYYANAQEEGRVHPTQKPLDLMLALVRDFSDPGDLILDPFAGVGSTLVAAKRTGRRALGWEIDPRFHAIARRRLAGTREQLGLFAGGA